MEIGLHLFTYLKRIDDGAIALLDRLRELGFDGCEVPIIPGNFALRDATLFRSKLEANRMFCVTGTGIPPEMDTVSDDPAVRRRGVDHLKRCVDRSVELGSQLLAGALYAAFGSVHTCARTAEQWNRSAEALREACSYAEQRGVTLALEPLNRYEHFFINTISDAVALVRAVGAPNLRVHIDTYHMNIEERGIADAVEGGSDLIAHVHCSENDRGAAGSGHFEWEELFRALASIGYRGRIVLESFFEPIPEIAAFTPIWRTLAPGPDALCREGLAFLRELCRRYGL